MSLAVNYYEGGKTYIITELVTGLTWSGDIARCGRSCNITILNTVDNETKAVTFAMGGTVRAYWAGEEFFRGVIFKTDYAANGACTITAHDYNYYLTKNSDSQKFVNKKASQIVASLCKQFGIATGQIDDTSYVMPKLTLRGKTLYDMITIALTETRKKTGKVFLLGNELGKLTLRERGEQSVQFTVADGSNLLSANYSESIEDLRNSVRLTGKSGEDATGVTVTDSASVKNYGRMQDKRHESDKTDAELKPIANALLAELNKVARESSVESFGDVTIIAGKSVRVSERMTGLSGSYYVITDTHTFEPSGLHKMSLTLSKTLDVAEQEYQEVSD